MPRVEWSFFMPAEDHKQVKRLMAYAQSRLTAWGQIIFLVILVGLAISSVGTQISAYLLPSFILALLITSYLYALFFKPKIEARRLLPHPPTAGSHCIYKVVIKNIGKRPVRNLAVFEQALPYGLYPLTRHPQFNNTIDWLYPGQTHTLTLAFRTPRRGIFDLPQLIAGSSFPSGIMRSTARVGKIEKFIVYPKLYQKNDLILPVHRQFQPGGISLSSKVGDSNEFASTREYRQGDRLRDIHWTSSAKIGKLIVKEYIEEYFVRIGLFLDTELRRYEKHKSFEARIGLCSGIADMLNKNDYIVDLYLSDMHYQHVQAGRGVGDFHHLLKTCSAIEGDRQVDFTESAARIKAYALQLSMLIVFLKDWDDKRKDFLQKLMDLGINVRGIIISDQPTSLDLSDEPIDIFQTNDLIKSSQ